MIGPSEIGVYIPDKKVNNAERIRQHGISEKFLDSKIGIKRLSRKEDFESASDLCVKAFNNFRSQVSDFDLSNIGCICVCTQNGDYQLPQTSAIVHSKLGLDPSCASFDISLGCSGYVYSLLIVKGFMECNNIGCGVVFTSDPYSDIIDDADKNTGMLFGDAATATLLTAQPVFKIQKGVFETDGSRYTSLIKRKNQHLQMNGREIFNFVLKNVPSNLNRCIELNNVAIGDIDYFLFHQASKYIIDHLRKRMNICPNKSPFEIQDYGNTVSSSIPILLKDYLKDINACNVILCGFGVGLSISSLYLRRN